MLLQYIEKVKLVVIKSKLFNGDRKSKLILKAQVTPTEKYIQVFYHFNEWTAYW